MQILYPKLLKADAILIASPVYWFNVSAQTKLWIDRLYAFGSAELNLLSGKKFGIILTYEDPDPFVSGAVNPLRALQDMIRYIHADLVGMVLWQRPSCWRRFEAARAYAKSLSARSENGSPRLIKGRSMATTPYSFKDVLRLHQEIDLVNWQFGGEKMHYMFLSCPEFLPHAMIKRSGEISQLEYQQREDVAWFSVDSKLGRMPFDAYVQAAPVNGVILLHKNRVVYEAYPRMRPFDKHIYMSVTKAYVGTVLAILEDSGRIELQQPVEAYLPELKGSGWQGVAVRDVLDMTSGIASMEADSEAYTNPHHPHYQYEASLGWLEPTEDTFSSTYDHIASLKSHRPPGQAFEYSSSNTFLLSWLAEVITGKPFHEIMTEEIWGKLGAELDALISISKAGAPATHGGLSGTLRDMARFGRLFTPSYRQSAAVKVISDAYLERIQHGGRSELFDRGVTGSTMIKNLAGEKPHHNTYQWDFVMPDGDFFKGGFGGQGLYISPSRDLVMAFFGTPFDDRMEENELVWIARQLVRSGLFA